MVTIGNPGSIWEKNLAQYLRVVGLGMFLEEGSPFNTVSGVGKTVLVEE